MKKSISNSVNVLELLDLTLTNLTTLIQAYQTELGRNV